MFFIVPTSWPTLYSLFQVPQPDHIICTITFLKNILRLGRLVGKVQTQMYIILSTIIFFLTTSLIIAYPLLPRVSLPLPFSVLATSCMTKIYRNEEGSQKIKQNRRQWIVKLIFHKNHSTLVTENKTKFRAKITMLLYRAFHESWEWFLTPWWHIDFIIYDVSSQNDILVDFWSEYHSINRSIGIKEDQMKGLI